METTFQKGKIKCRCYKSDGDRVVYLLFPMESAGEWLAQAATEFRLNIVAVSGMDWDNDLTPWPATGVPAGEADFKGEAAEFLRLLREEIVPEAERILGVAPVAGESGSEGRSTSRDLIGVSLSGLFAMWQWALCDEFRSVAVLSGSFWYEGFTQWFAEHCPQGKPGEAYLLLGDAESRSQVPEFRTIDRTTKEVVETLRNHGIQVKFESVPGNHYQYTFERLSRAFTFLSGC